MWQWILKWSDNLRHRGRLKRWNMAQAWGRRGEDLAHRHLRAKGFTVLARNYRTRSGSAEVDIVALDGDTTVFVEVKTRETEDFGSPDRAINQEKREHIFRAAAEYLRRSEKNPECARFDVVNVVFGSSPAIRHIPDAFQRPRWL